MRLVRPSSVRPERQTERQLATERTRPAALERDVRSGATDDWAHALTPTARPQPPPGESVGVGREGSLGFVAEAPAPIDVRTSLISLDDLPFGVRTTVSPNPTTPSGFRYRLQLEATAGSKGAADAVDEVLYILHSSYDNGLRAGEGDAHGLEVDSLVQRPVPVVARIALNGSPEQFLLLSLSISPDGNSRLEQRETRPRVNDKQSPA